MPQPPDFYPVTNLPEAAFGLKFWADFVREAVAATAGAGIGALLGARYAFRLERHRAAEERAQRETHERKLERDRQALAGNIAMFTLSRMYNTLLNFYQQRIEPHLDDPLLWYFMPPGGEPSLEGIDFDYRSLAFLLKSESPSIVLRLDTLGDHYRTLADFVRRRSQMHETEIEPKLEKVTILPGTPAGNLEAYLGRRLIITIKNYTDDIVRLVLSALDELPTVGKELYDLLKKRMPEENFIWFTRAVDKDGKPVP